MRYMKSEQKYVDYVSHKKESTLNTILVLVP